MQYFDESKLNFQSLNFIFLLILFLVGCQQSYYIKSTDKLPECRFEKLNFSDNINHPPSEEFVGLLNASLIGHYKISGDDILMYSETGSRFYFYTIYRKSGLVVGYKDANGVDMTVQDSVNAGPSINAYDMSALRTGRFLAEKSVFEMMNPDPRTRSSRPFFAGTRPDYCE